MKVIHRLSGIEIYKNTNSIYGILTRESNDDLIGLLDLLKINNEVVSDKDVKLKATLTFPLLVETCTKF